VRFVARSVVLLPLTLVAACDLIDRIRDEIERRDRSPSSEAPSNVPTSAPPSAATQPLRPTLPEALAPAPQGSYTPNGTFTPEFLQMETRVVLSELLAALSPDHRARVQHIPLEYTQNLAEVNAAAGCTRTGRSLMAVTGGMLALVSAVSEAKAIDELAGTRLLDAYYEQTLQAVRRNQPVPSLPPGAVPAQLALDPRKLARQRHLFDQQIGFILGHELGHHYRGHTGCAGGGDATGQEALAEEVVRIASNTLPLFNQPVELEADAWGVVNLLDAGARRVGGRWTEEGGLLSMDFFQRLEGERSLSPILLFVRTHPPAVLRRPILQMWADKWRRGERPTTVGQGGIPLPVPIPFGDGQRDGGSGLPLPLPIPGLGGNAPRDGGVGSGGLPFPLPIPLPTR
jgi:hypothetical protein